MKIKFKYRHHQNVTSNMKLYTKNGAMDRKGNFRPNSILLK